MAYFVFGGVFIVGCAIIRSFPPYQNFASDLASEIRSLIQNPSNGIEKLTTARDYVHLKARNLFSEYAECGKVCSTKEYYTITYYNGSQRYKHIFPKKRGTLGIFNVMASNNDVTDVFREYLGPGQNFHGSKPTPKFLGFNNGLFITFMDGKTLAYEPDEQMSF